MPSCISHAVVGVCAGAAVSNGTSPKRLLLYSILAAVLPDIDVFAFALNIPYDHLFGHRGFFHSILFAGLAGPLIAWLFFRREQFSSRGMWFYSGYFSFLIFIHVVFDALTNGGEGVAFFAPFTNERIFFHFTPIEVSPVNLKQFFDERFWVILASELVWVWAPALGAAALVRLLLVVYRKRLPVFDQAYRKAGPDS
ncbi:MAG: metal-dependent hydrolase [Deltaproteobacteria bacterium]